MRSSPSVHHQGPRMSVRANAQTGIRELHRQLVSKERSAQDVAKHYLTCLKEREERVKAFIRHDEAGALEQAARVDARIAKGETISLLAGIPLAIKVRTQ